MRRLYLGLQHALRPGRIFNRLRQLFPRRKDKTTGHGGSSGAGDCAGWRAAGAE